MSARLDKTVGQDSHLTVTTRCLKTEKLGMPTGPMRPSDLIRRRFAESAAVKRALDADEHVGFTARLAELLVERLRAQSRVLLCGNGGSAADATHLCAELVGRFQFDRPALAAMSLSDN